MNLSIENFELFPQHMGNVVLR